jgi:hypothetical protein
MSFFIASQALLVALFWKLTAAVLTIYAPMIYTAPCTMFWMRAYPLQREVGGSWTLEFYNYFVPWVLYGVVRSGFGGGTIHNEGHFRGEGPTNRDFFGPLNGTSVVLPPKRPRVMDSPPSKP